MTTLGPLHPAMPGLERVFPIRFPNSSVLHEAQTPQRDHSRILSRRIPESILDHVEEFFRWCLGCFMLGLAFLYLLIWSSWPCGVGVPVQPN